MELKHILNALKRRNRVSPTSSLADSRKPIPKALAEDIHQSRKCVLSFSPTSCLPHGGVMVRTNGVFAVRFGASTPWLSSDERGTRSPKPPAQKLPWTPVQGLRQPPA